MKGKACLKVVLGATSLMVLAGWAAGQDMGRPRYGGQYGGDRPGQQRYGQRGGQPAPFESMRVTLPDTPSAAVK